MLQAIIFDMDGVLINSGKYIFQSFNMVLEKHGVSLPETSRKRYLGRSLKEQLDMMKKEYANLPDISVEDFSKEAFGYQVELMEKELQSDIFLDKLIKEAMDNEIKVAVATSSSRKRAKFILERLGVQKKLNILVTCEDVARSKPAPDLFLEAAAKINVRPENCVVIEDALNGIRAAEDAGMKTVAKLTQFHDRDEFAGVGRIFSGFQELTLDDLKRLWG